VSAERDDRPIGHRTLEPYTRRPWPHNLAPRQPRPPWSDASLRRAAAAAPPPRRRSDTSVAQGISLSRVDLPSNPCRCQGCSLCSLGLSATSQQCFSLRPNQPLATSQQYFSLKTNQHHPSATSRTNRLAVGVSDRRGDACFSPP
jgi:hypothetical protein